MARRLSLIVVLVFALLAALPASAQSEPVVLPTAFGQPRVEFSPDGRRVAVFETAGYAIAMETVPNPLNTVVMIYDTATGEALASLTGARDFIGSLIFTPDGAQVIGLASNGDLLTWDAATGELLHSVRTPILNQQTPLFWHPQTGELVAAIQNVTHTAYGTLDPATGALTLLTYNLPITTFAEWMAWQGERRSLIYGDNIVVPAPHTEALAELPLAGDVVWTVNPQGQIALLSLGSGERNVLREGDDMPRFSITDLVATPSGLIGFNDEREKTVTLFDLNTGEETSTATQHRSARLSPDAARIAQYKEDETALLLSPVGEGITGSYSFPDGLSAGRPFLMRVRFSPDGSRLAALGLQNADEQQHVVLYDLSGE